MRIIVLNMQSGLYAKAIQRTLLQELTGYQVVISESLDKTVERCKTYFPCTLLMEVIGHLHGELKNGLPCRIN